MGWGNEVRQRAHSVVTSACRRPWPYRPCGVRVNITLPRRRATVRSSATSTTASSKAKSRLKPMPSLRINPTFSRRTRLVDLVRVLSRHFCWSVGKRSDYSTRRFSASRNWSSLEYIMLELPVSNCTYNGRRLALPQYLCLTRLSDSTHEPNRYCDE